jgi:1,4-dihydroxy-2-naphthoate octaprenyltransferase
MDMIKYSTIQLLRFPFSFFLMPVYWFALGQAVPIKGSNALLVFMILHLFVYPASNGYNSYMDRDQGSIGGVKNPLQPSRQLFWFTICMDILAIILGFCISFYFVAGISAYILSSRAYSYRGIRLKKYPILGYLTVIIFQGAVVFWLVYHGGSANKSLSVPVVPMVASSLLIGGFYPLTQIYQHESDLKDGVRTISYLLGKRGTFIYCGIVYCIAFSFLAYYFFTTKQVKEFFIVATGMLPVLVSFFAWAGKVWKDERSANFSNTMRINLTASVCTNATFIIIFILHQFE